MAGRRGDVRSTSSGSDTPGEVHRHRQTLLVGIAGVLVGAAAVVVPQVLPDNDDPDAPGPNAGERFISVVASESANWITATPAADLGQPPRFDLDRGRQESHCSDWIDWFPTVGLAPTSGTFLVQIRAPASAPVVLTKLQARIHAFDPWAGAGTTVRCTYGAGGYYAHVGSLPVGGGPLEVSSETATGVDTFTVPDDQFQVAAGLTEVIDIALEGDPGFYRWSAEATAVIDQREYVVQLGSEEEPLITFVAPADDGALANAAYIDWDIERCEWSPANYNIVDVADTRVWRCG